MLKNYFIIAIRNLFRNKLFSLINILGLAAGISCSLIILVWVQDELNTDAFHLQGNQLYRVLQNHRYSNGEIYTDVATPGPLRSFMKETFPEVRLSTRLTWLDQRLFKANDKSFYEKGRFVDPDFLQMFTFPMKEGNILDALKDIHSIVLTGQAAARLFGNENALGKTLLMDESESFTVTGILEELPANSSLRFDFLIPFDWYLNKNKDWLEQWGESSIGTVVLLNANATPESFQRKMKGVMRSRLGPQHEGELFIQRFSDYYLHGEFKNGVISGGRIERVQVFSAIAILVLVIACINFMNLTTAQSEKRSKEVGLRKTIGAIRWQVALQFFCETLLIVFTASLLGLLICSISLPVFSQIIGKTLSLDLLSLQSIIILLSIVMLTGLIAGSYPAIYLSGFQPAQVLKGKMKPGRGSFALRKILVVSQFTLSIVLIAGTLVINKQMDYIESKDIGLEREGIIYLRMKGDMRSHVDAIKSELVNNPVIENVSFCSTNPIDFGGSRSDLEWEGKDPALQIAFASLSVDDSFIESMGMKMAEGRNFRREYSTDTTTFIINETAARAMGFDHASDQLLTLGGTRRGKIIGVVRDFNFQSIHNKVEPLFMTFDPSWYNVILVRYKTGHESEAIEGLKEINSRYAPSYPFEYSFLSQDWDKQYKSESQFGAMFSYFSILSVLISFLGLFGLSSFSAEKRIKELGIRKILGAGIPSLMLLLASEVIILTLIASVLGSIIGWYVVDRWLSTFVYHVDLDLVIFLIASGAAVCVAILTVSFHSAKAARANPIKNLRIE
ncbi:MAG TPA: ABC transporter permease [Ohtaekwangia sp.]|uniref:ABC transporter permease n=1 Tax=Ohtaekwangia sp. TaxID=2066019 RepID=UPI002F92085F